MAIGGNPGDLATGGFGTGISGRAATGRDVAEAVARGERMAREREIGQGSNVRDGGFAASNNAAARAAADAQVNALRGTNFGGGGLLGGNAAVAIPAFQDTGFRGPMGQWGSAASIVPSSILDRALRTGTDFARAYGDEFSFTPESMATAVRGSFPMTASYARDESGRYIKDEQGNYVTTEPTVFDIRDAFNAVAADETGQLQGMANSLLGRFNDPYGRGLLGDYMTQRMRAESELGAPATAAPAQIAKATDRIAPSEVPAEVVSPIEGSVVYRSPQQIPVSPPAANVPSGTYRPPAQPPISTPSDVAASDGISIQGGYRGITGPMGELRIQPTSYGTNYQTAQALRQAYPGQFGKYSTPEIADTLETFSRAIPGESAATMFGVDAMNNIARVGLNQIVGGYSPEKMLRGMDTTGMREAARGFEYPSANSLGMTENWNDPRQGDVFRQLAANAIREAAFGQGVDPEAMNASNFVARGTPMVPGVTPVGGDIQGIQYGSDPNWGKRIEYRNRAALGLLGAEPVGTYTGSADVVVPPAEVSPRSVTVDTVAPPQQQAVEVATPAAPELAGSGLLTDTIPARTDRSPATIQTPRQDMIGNTLSGLLGIDYGGYPNAGSARLGWDTVMSEPTPYSPPAEDATMMERFANVFEPGNLFPYAKDVSPIQGTPEGQYIQQTETGPLKGYIDVPYRYEPMDKPVYGAPGVPDGWTAPVRGASVITFKDGGGVWKHPSQGWQPISQFTGDMGDTYKGEGGRKNARKEERVAQDLNEGGVDDGSTTTSNSTMLPQWYFDWLSSQGQTGGLLA